MMEDDVSRFWQRVETLKPGSWKELADLVAVDFDLMMTQKYMNRLPRIADLCHFAKKLHTSVEWLVSGFESESAAALRLGNYLDDRLRRIFQALENADESLLQKVEALIQSSIQ